MLWSDFERLGSFLTPWRELENLNRTFSRWISPSTVEFPPVNIWISGDNAIVTTEIPGIDPKAVDISLVGKTLTIRGSRQPEEIKSDGSYHRRERWDGQFSKTIELPFNIEANNVNARFVNGILYINLPRAEADKPKKIIIKSE